MSPRVPVQLSGYRPPQLLLKAEATRATYAGEGLLVTRCWMSCFETNGPTFGWLKMLSSATVKSACAHCMFTVPLVLAQAVVVTPFKRVFAPKSWFVPPRGTIGSR